MPYILACAFGKKGKKQRFESFLVGNMMTQQEPKPVMSQKEMEKVLSGIAAAVHAKKGNHGDDH